MGALTSYRVSEKIGKMFGWAVDKMTIWKSVQQIGSQMEFTLDPNEEPHGEADGTGVGITGIAKRGKELKVLIQYKKGGGIRVAGIDIGNYNGSWDKLERLFRTVNMRVNVSKWSTEGALNVTKVRLAYYYKGFDT